MEIGWKNNNTLELFLFFLSSRFTKMLQKRKNKLMRKYYPIIITLIIAVLAISACNKTLPGDKTPADVTSEVTPEETTAPFPASDKSRVCGMIVYSDKSPFDDDTIYLAPVYEGTAIVLDTSSSPGAKTDQDGKFCTTDITPGDYVLIIGSPELSYEIYSEDGTSAVVYTAEAGETLDIGVVETNLLP